MLYDPLMLGNTTKTILWSSQIIKLDEIFHYGVRRFAHETFKNYLSQRSQYITDNAVASCTKFIICVDPSSDRFPPLVVLDLLFKLFLQCMSRIGADTCTIVKRYGIFEKHNGNTRIWHFDLLEMARQQPQTSIITLMQLSCVMNDRNAMCNA